MIEPNPALNDTSATIDATWTVNSLRVYLDTRLEALKELKAHDLHSFHERVDTLERRMGQIDEARRAIIDEIDRRLQERQDLTTAFIRERFDYNKIATETMAKAGNESSLLANQVLREVMTNGFRSVDDRFRLAKEFNEQISKAATDSLSIALTASNEAVRKAEQAVEKRFDCVEASTPVLCADLVWRPAGELVVGDVLIGFDEESVTRRGRRLRKSFVTANSLAEDKLFEVATCHGSVRCNGHHPWLVLPKLSTSRAEWRWVQTSDLQIDDQVMRPAELWTIDTSWESGSIRPPRLLVKSDGVWDGRPINGNHRETFVKSVDLVGNGVIAQLSTSTKTYIAGGFAMHNTVNEFRQSLNDLSSNMIQRTEVVTMINSTTDKISDLASRMDRMQGADRHSQASTTTLLSIAAVVVAATVGIIAFVNSNRTASTPFDATRNFYAPSVQIPPGLPRQ
jgi:hypothetical protein